MNELKPCPFCGGAHLNICKTEYPANNAEVYAVTCLTKGCHGGIYSLGMGNFTSKMKATKAWNTRANDNNTKDKG